MQPPALRSTFGPRFRLNHHLLGSLKLDDLIRGRVGMGQKYTTRNWTAGSSPCFHLPEFQFGYLILTHSHEKKRIRFLGQKCMARGQFEKSRSAGAFLEDHFTG